MDKYKLKEIIDGMGALAEFMALTYKTMINAGLEAGEAVALSKAILEVVLGHSNE